MELNRMLSYGSSEPSHCLHQNFKTRKLCIQIALKWQQHTSHIFNLVFCVASTNPYNKNLRAMMNDGTVITI